jgi:RNA polymerase-associated protein RTF1
VSKIALPSSTNRTDSRILKKLGMHERRVRLAKERALARGEKVTIDPSRRVRTKVKFNHDVSDDDDKKLDIQQAVVPAVETPMVTNTSDTITPKVESDLEKRPFGALQRPLCEDDIIASADFALEIEI